MIPTKTQQKEKKPVNVQLNDIYKFNETQNYLYRKLIMGVNGIPKNLHDNLSCEHKKEIEKRASKVQKLLNLWKQELCIKKTNNLFESLFPNTEFTKQLTQKFNIPYLGYTNTLDFKVLGITKQNIIKKLIENGYLPTNFYELKENLVII